MVDQVVNVLFLCTGNSARSILAESILAQEGGAGINAFSAGSHPKGEVHPLALKTLAALGYPHEGFRSKSWDEFGVPGSPVFDFIFTVCDNAAGEVCPVWLGHPMVAHWGIEDPAAVDGTVDEQAHAFAEAARFLRHRIQVFLRLPLTAPDKALLLAQVRQIGTLEGSTSLDKGII